MKKRFLLVLSLCLLLTACSTPPSPAPVPTYTLPALELEPFDPDLLDPTEPAKDPGDLLIDVPVLNTDVYPNLIIGPSGTLEAQVYIGDVESVAYGDLEGDGTKELFYLCPGPTSGLYTKALFVYGLEGGWPVFKGGLVFRLGGSDALSLVTAGDKVRLAHETTSVDSDAEGFMRFTYSNALPVTLMDGMLHVGDGNLPAGLEIWGQVVPIFGAYLGDLRGRVADRLLLDTDNLLVWTADSEFVPSEFALPESEPTSVFAAVSDNGVSVTGYLCWGMMPDGSVSCMGQGLKPIPVTDPETLIGQPLEALEDRFGPAHFNFLLPSWFTEDGKLLMLYGGSVVEDYYVWDMTAGLLFGQDEDMVIVMGRSAGSGPRLYNQKRWDRFLETTARGEADKLALLDVFDRIDEDGTLITIETAYILDYDGLVYTLENSTEGQVQQYAYLIVDHYEFENADRTYSGLCCLLSDDPDMTLARYLSRFYASSLLPDFPPTVQLFQIVDE